MKKYGIGLICFLLFFFGISFSSAFVNFSITPESTNFTIPSLESSTSNFTVSFNTSAIPEENEPQPYSIDRETICNQYNDDYNCTDPVPDLCPYISIQPNGEENTEIGFPLNYYFPWSVAEGELNSPTDTTDNWNLSVTSPCFEDECPAGYDAHLHGEPLPQVLKNQTFKCDIAVNWNGSIYPVLGPIKTAYAAVTNTMTVSAVFTGSAEQKIDPVIIIPGIMGSAYKDGVWTIDPIFHVYDNLIETLENNGYVQGENIFPFGYDWKNSNTETAVLLKQKIDSIKEICDCDKVDIIAHSMGGLVARSYAQSNNYGNDIDQLIFLGTPHEGAPKDYLTWEAGEIFGTNIQTSILRSVMKKDAKEHGYTGENALFNYVKGWPITSTQELLPIYVYLKDADTDEIVDYPDGYPENNFLENLKQGTVALLESDINITNIIGETENNNTIVGIRITDSDKLPLWEHGYPENYDNGSGDRGLIIGYGDGTVPVVSASISNSIDLRIPSGHINLPTDAEEEIFAEINGGELIDPVKTSLPLKILFAKIFSPADFVIIAPDGKRVGKDFATNQEINEITGAFYSGFNTDDEYITIPDPLDGEYKIQLQGTGSGGPYSFETTYISDTVSTTTEISGITAPNQITDLFLNLDSQNPENTEIERVVTLDVLIADINQAYDLGWIKDKKTRDGLIREAKLIIKFEKKRNGKYEKKVDKILIKLIEKELDFLLKKEKITVKASNLLKEDLKYIINNN